MKERYTGDFNHWDKCIQNECNNEIYLNAEMMDDHEFDELLLDEKAEIIVPP